MSGMFKIIENETAIVREGGVYKEVQLAVRNNGELYVKMRGGFVRLYGDGTTSLGSKVSLDTLALGAPLYRDSFGKLSIAAGPNRKLIAETPSFIAIGKEDDDA